jgi:hypothetical protein
MKEEIGFVGNQLNQINTCFTVGYVLGQIPSNLSLHYVRPRFFFPSMMLAWAGLTSKQLLDTILPPSRSKFCQMWPVPQMTYHTAGFETGYAHIVTLSSTNLYETTPLVL